MRNERGNLNTVKKLAGNITIEKNVSLKLWGNKNDRGLRKIEIFIFVMLENHSEVKKFLSPKTKT